MIRILILLGILWPSAIQALSSCDNCTSNLIYLKAERVYFSENKSESIKIFREAFKNHDYGTVATFYNTADKAIRIDSFDFATFCLEKAITKGANFDGLQAFSERYSSFEFDPKYLFKKVCKQNDKAIDIDSLLLKDLLHMVARDQEVREHEDNVYWDKRMKNTDYMNFLWLKLIIKQLGGQLPSIENIGIEGQEAIETLIMHFEIEWLAEIFPALVSGICSGYTYGEDLLYQIERNIVDNGALYYYNAEKQTLLKDTIVIPTIKNSPFHYQYYGGFDLFSMKKMKKIWWPFYDKADMDKVNNLRKALCLDSLEEQLQRKARVKKVSDEVFLEIIQH